MDSKVMEFVTVDKQTLDDLITELSQKNAILIGLAAILDNVGTAFFATEEDTRAQWEKALDWIAKRLGYRDRWPLHYIQNVSGPFCLKPGSGNAFLFTPMGQLVTSESDLVDQERRECPRCHLAVLEEEFNPEQDICIYCVLEQDGWGAGPRFPALATVSTHTPKGDNLVDQDTVQTLEALQAHYDEILAAIRAVEHAGAEEHDLLLSDLRRSVDDLHAKNVEALGGKPERNPGRQVIVVHNAWTVLGMEDGKEIDDPLATLGRPQDWGDPKWHYSRFRFDWYMPEAQYINHVHIWTDLVREESEYPRLFAGLITAILLPGLPAPLAGRDVLDVEDSWLKEWGPTPPVWDGEDEFFTPGDDFYGVDEPRGDSE
jgi:hypothetical protein